MKKMKFLGTVILAASLLFAGCSSSVDDVVAEEDTSVTLSPEETGTTTTGGTSTGGTSTGGSSTGGSSTGGSSSGGSSTGGNSGSGSNEPEINYTAPDLSSYYKNYFVSTTESVTTTGFDSWGSGSVRTINSDGSWSFTPGSGWGGSISCAALTGLSAGTLANYEYFVFTIDTTDFNITYGTGNNGINVKVPEVQEDFSTNCVVNGNLRTYYVPMSSFGTQPESATEFAIIIGGTGTLKITELYIAAADDPATREVTGITITPVTASISQNGTQQFTVKDSNHAVLTSGVTYTLTGDAETGSDISATGLLTVGTTPGSLTVTASYTVDGETFTRSATITVLGEVENLITTVSANCSHYSTDGNWTNISDATTVEVNNNVVSFTKPDATYEDWRAQVLINTDADVAEGDAWYFSCRLSGVDGNYIIKLNNDESLITQRTGTFTEEGTVVSFSGTSSVNHTDLPVMFGIGNTPAGTIVISDITFVKTN